MELETEKDRSERDFERQLEQQESRARIDINGLKSDLGAAKEKLDALTEFAEKKDIIEETLANLKAELEREKLDHAKNVQELERRNVQEKERLKKEMLIKIKETKQNLLSMTEDQLHTTTKRTIMENEQMTTELQYQCKETEKLLVASKRLGADY